MTDFEELLPQAPEEGPPLPRSLGIKWPGGKAGNPGFARAQYVKIAYVLARQPDTVDKRKLVDDLSDMFAEDNPRFDEARFKKASSVG